MIKDGKLVCKEARIETSSWCNAHCVSCPREKLTRPMTTMPTEHFAGLVNQLVTLGAETIGVFGFGEPLLDEELYKKIAYCTNKGLKTHITTNGSLMDTEKAFGLIKAGLTNIRFSIHGTTSRAYNSFHKGLEWNTTIKNLFNFISIKKKNNDSCSTHVISLLSNGDDPEIIKRRWEPEVDYLEIWKPHGWAGGRKGYRTIKHKKKSCERPFSGPIQINADGHMMVCCFDYNAVMTIGDTYKDSIEKILNGKELKLIQERHRSGLHQKPCLSCDQLNEYKESMLVYSNLDKTRSMGKLSTTKCALGG